MNAYLLIPEGFRPGIPGFLGQFSWNSRSFYNSVAIFFNIGFRLKWMRCKAQILSFPMQQQVSKSADAIRKYVIQCTGTVTKSKMAEISGDEWRSVTLEWSMSRICATKKVCVLWTYWKVSAGIELRESLSIFAEPRTASKKTVQFSVEKSQIALLADGIENAVSNVKCLSKR